jgi:hypothetical protein
VIDDDSIIESATLAVSADDSAVVGVSAESPEVGTLDTVSDVRIGSSTVVASSPLTPTNVVVAGAGAGVGARAFAVSSIVVIAGTEVEVDFVVGGDVGVVPTVVVEVVEVVVVADVVVVVVVGCRRSGCTCCCGHSENGCGNDARGPADKAHENKVQTLCVENGDATCPSIKKRTKIRH